MESCKAKLGLMAWLVLSSLTTANSTSFQECYATCFVICAITPGVAFSDCPLRCLQACIIPSFPIHNAAADDDFHRQQKNQFFCELGCAASSCTKFSTHQNPGISEPTEYVGGPNCYFGCINSCFESAFQCAICIGKCMISVESTPMQANHMDNRYFCKLGCSTSRCAKLLLNHPNEKQMKGCVNSCSHTCTNIMN
ncbi:hypothetical protein SDJN03_26197, partial [Cucurbita argyrosperma subsp. sororia]